MSFDIVRLTQDALWLVLVLSGPPILVASIAGLLVAFIQAATQLQEQTLAFTIKLVAVVVTLFLMAGVLGETLIQYSNRIFDDFPSMVGN